MRWCKYTPSMDSNYRNTFDYLLVRHLRNEIIRNAESHAEECLSSRTRLFEKFRTKCVDTIGLICKEGPLRHLANRVLQHNGLVTKSLEQALAATDQDHILVYIPSIYLYAVFTPNEYFAFVSQLKDSSDDTVLGYHPKQLLRTVYPQKVIFICDNMETVQELSRGCMEYFKCSVTIINNGDKIELAVNHVVANSSALQDSIVGFLKYMETKNVATDSFRTLPTHTVGGGGGDPITNITYIETNLSSDHVNALNVEELLEMINGGPVTFK